MEVTCRTVSPGPCCALLCLLELRWLLAWSPDASQPLLLERRGLSVAQGQKGGWTAKKKKVFTDRKGEMTEKEKKKNLSTQGKHCSVGRNTHSDELMSAWKKAILYLYHNMGFKKRKREINNKMKLPSSDKN